MVGKYRRARASGADGAAAGAVDTSHVRPVTATSDRHPRRLAVVAGDGNAVPGFALDPVRLERIFEADSRFGERVVGLFEAEVCRRVAELAVAETVGDATMVRRVGHELKGTCLTVGATRMAAGCERIERAGADGSLADLGRLRAELEITFAGTLQELRERGWRSRHVTTPAA